MPYFRDLETAEEKFSAAFHLSTYVYLILNISAIAQFSPTVLAAPL